VSKQYWRLLEPGECVQRGDEYHLKGEGPWVSVEVNDIGDVIDHGHVPYRRRITLPEPQGWISVKERMPTKEDGNKQGNVLWRMSFKDGDRRLRQGLWDTEIDPCLTHWVAIPDEPEDESNPDEEAFEKFWKKAGGISWGRIEALSIFLAGRKSVATEGGQP
jgi:hypothetical protein